MPTLSRFTASVAYKILGISVLIALLFIAGCTTNGSDSGSGSGTQFSVTTTSGQLATVVVNTVYPGATLTAANGTAPYTWTVTSGTLPPGISVTSGGTISGTPTQSGVFNFTVTATDSQGHLASASLTLTINQAPAITSVNHAPFTVGTAGTFTVTATGFPAPTFSETGALPSGVTLNSTTGLLSGTPAAGTGGNFVITITAQNGIGTNATQSFTLTNNQASAITSASSASFAIGALGSFTVVATGFPSPTITETGALPTGVNFNSTTGVLSGTPAVGTGGTYPIVITAQNGIGANATQNFTLSVNLAPAITSIDHATFTVGTAGAFTVTATGFPAPTFTETGALPAGVTLNSAGVLAGTPGAGTGGVYPITITAQNGVGTNATQSFTLTVNQASAITSANSAAFIGGALGSFTVVATGFPAPTLSETGALPTGVNFNSATGVLSGTPGVGTGGTYPIVITAQNGVGANATQNFTLSVNFAPAITSGNSTAFTVGTAGTFTVTATGFPAPTFSETGALPAGVTLNSTTGVLGGIPGAGTGGTYPIVITAQNGTGTNATQNFTLTVNQSPSITSQNATTFAVGSFNTFTVVATGFPAPTFSETGALPTGVTLNSTTGVLSGTPGVGTQGTYPIVITAQNGIGVNATQSFTLTASFTAAPIITSANSTTFTVGALESFTATASGTPAPTFTETGALPTGVTLNSTTGALSGTAGAGTAGIYPITITANNGVNPNAQQSFTLNVVAAPAITSFVAAAPTITLGSSTTLTAVFSGGTASINNGVGVVTSGTPVTVSPTTTTTYTLTVTNAATTPATTTATATVTVVAAPAITSFTAASPTIGSGNSTTLTAVFTGGTASINNGVGAVTSGTPVTVSPTTTTTYTLTVTNAATTPATTTAPTTVTVLLQPTISIAFNPTTVALNVNGATTLSYTVTNPNPSTSLTGVGFSNGLPTGLSMATPNGLTGSCGGGTITLNQLFNAVTLSLATLPGGASCTFSLNLTGTNAGVVNNTTGKVSSNQTGTGAVSNTASLTVLAPPTLTQLSVSGGPVGTPITITGTNFGTTQGSSTVTVNGVAATATSWSPTSISTTVPVGATGTGNVVVTVLGVATATTSASAFTVTAGLPLLTITVPGPTAAPPIQAGAVTPTTIAISVLNDVVGDVLTPTLFVNGSGACTPTTCGTLGPVSGTSGSSNYTLAYTPPSAANLTVTTTFTLNVTSSLSGAVGATTNFNVFPSGIVVILTGTAPNIVLPGTPARTTLRAIVYNDVVTAGVGAGATIPQLTGNGYACENLSPNSCGTLTVGSKATVGTTTTINLTYTPPPATGLRQPPYDRPRIQATSVADPTKVASFTYLITGTPLTQPLAIPPVQKFGAALTGAAPMLVSASFTDASTTKTANWTLKAAGVDCSPTCGTLGTPTTTSNGNVVISTVFYTPPSSVPTISADKSPTITATMAANSAATDNFQFTIVDGTCGTGNESILNGQYAFLLRGGGSGNGYNALIGSFTADGAGHITAGLEDFNRTIGVVTGLTINPAGSSYSVGSDNRGCLTLVNSNGGTQVYRIALGTLVGAPSTATQGSIIFFGDNNGQGMRLQGKLMKQDPSAFATSAISGTYAFGDEGVGSSGERVAVAGVATASGAGLLSNLATDTDDGGFLDTNDTAGSGTYTVAANGRGTAVFTRGTTSNFVLYMISASEVFSMSIDPLTQTTPILSGEYRKQTGTFTSTTMDNSGYVFYVDGLDNSTGGATTAIGQATFTTNGNTTLTLDENDSGVSQPEQVGTAVFTVQSNGRVTTAGTGVGNHPPVLYLVDSTQGFIVGTDDSVGFGFAEKQSAGPFSTSTITGQFFFGGGEPTTGSTFDSGTVTFVPGSPSGTLTGTDDSSAPNAYPQGCTGKCGGLDSNSSISDNGVPPAYTFSSSPTAPGQGNVGPQSIAYIISPSKVVFIQTGTALDPNAPEIFILQK